MATQGGNHFGKRGTKRNHLTVRKKTQCLRAGREGEGEAPQPQERMSYKEALEFFGVSEGVDFEEIVKAKQAIAERHQGDRDVLERAEAAYDALLLTSLNRRAAGEVSDPNVRWADVQKAPKPSQILPSRLRSAFKLPTIASRCALSLGKRSLSNLPSMQLGNDKGLPPCFLVPAPSKSMPQMQRMRREQRLCAGR